MIKGLFIKYLQGICTQDEFEQFLKWIKNDSLTDSGKNTIMEIWNEFEPEAGSDDRNRYNQILSKIHHQIIIEQSSSQYKIQKESTKNRILTWITRVAAILLLPVLSLFLYTNSSKNELYTGSLNELEVEAPACARINFELTDGTKVWLNHGSKLKYPSRFTGKNRNVFLTGEAFFEVAHNKDIPFVVGTSRIDVKATGTVFNVSAYPDEDLVETTLVEGRVILFEKDGNLKIKALSPNECLKYDSKKHGYILETEDTKKYTAWKDGKLVLKNDLIEDVAKKLSRWYNIDVEISDTKAKEFTFTATFSDETLPQALELLSSATPVVYKLTESKRLPDGSYTKQKVIIGFR